MQRMFAPFSASAAIFSAPARVPPEVMPTKMPSWIARSLLQRMASGPAIGRMRSMTFIATASSVSLGIKSGVQPCIGCGLNVGCGAAGVPSEFRDCAMPLANSYASSGSQTTIFVSGRSELTPLDAKWFCHSDHQRVSLGCANHGKTDPRISACRLYDRLARLKLSRLFGGLDYPKSQSVLH